MLVIVMAAVAADPDSRPAAGPLVCQDVDLLVMLADPDDQIPDGGLWLFVDQSPAGPVIVDYRHVGFPPTAAPQPSWVNGRWQLVFFDGYDDCWRIVRFADVRQVYVRWPVKHSGTGRFAGFPGLAQPEGR